MNTRFAAVLGVLALAGLCASPALAADGDGQPAPAETKGAVKEAKPATACGSESKECGAAKDCGASKECGGDKACGDGGACCAAGAAEGKECCKEKEAKRARHLVTLAALADGDAAKPVLAAIPAEALKKVEEARKAAFETAVKIHRNLAELKKELDALAAQAKADGKEAACEVKAALENDAKVLKGKAHEALGNFSKVLVESVGADKVEALAAEVRKAGDAAKAFSTKLDAAVKAVDAAKPAGEAPGEEPAKPPCKTGT